ncbi:hypothetical protein [Hymenobacter norwichensis]|uniref:hypothetical protein n=1 Tax=Hymenobacter norwichensis TaxID=223903 RepID=UPI0003B364FF|nr:hypothetical protein [Hymenobacter norwichensis]
MPTTGHSVYFENAIGRITEDPNEYAFVQYYPVPRQLIELRALLTHLGQLLLRRGWHRVLVDMHLIPPLSEAEKTLLTQDWYGGSIARPAQLCTAFWMAKDVIARLSVHEMQAEARKQQNQSNAFASLDEARAYLLAC